MKNLFLSLLLTVPVLLPAQVEYLRLSPAQKISQRVGMTDVDITETTANLGISWERTRVDIPITFYTREAMETQFKTEFDQNIFDLTIAATYYYERDIALEKAKELQEIAIQLRGEASVWDLHRYGIIHMKMGKREEAIKYLTQSLNMAVDTQNTYLIGENEKLLENLSQKDH
ncbi:MAG: hypothetical protein AAF741_13780 [Bacteroidota bacterium]